MGQVGLALCNTKRTQQLQVIAAVTDESIHLGEASIGVLAKKAGGVVCLFKGKPMNARLRNNLNNTCHVDIPVEITSHTGEIKDVYADPLSVIIKETPPPTLCSNAPAMFEIKKNEEDTEGTRYCLNEKGPHNCQSPDVLTPHSPVWKDTRIGLAWLGMKNYDRATITALHHYQNLDNMQKTHKGITTISRITETDNVAFINEAYIYFSEHVQI